MSPAAPEPVRTKVVTEVFRIKGAPSYMVSFGDMMTLILCFFILLVSMAKERQYGLMAKGVGSFIVSTKSMGLTGVLDAHEKQAIFEQTRRKFNLPPEEDPERRAPHLEASQKELLRAEALEALKPVDELNMPRVVLFSEGSAVLTPPLEDYLDSLAPTLEPQRGQLLTLFGHASDEESAAVGGRELLAWRRARVVRDYLIAEHAFAEKRVTARIWLDEFTTDASGTRAVDARIVTPPR